MFLSQCVLFLSQCVLFLSQCVLFLSQCVLFFSFRGDDDIADMVRIPDCYKFDDVSAILYCDKLKLVETPHKFVADKYCCHVLMFSQM